MIQATTDARPGAGIGTGFRGRAPIACSCVSGGRASIATFRIVIIYAPSHE
ncbi:MAG: hypothetical protein JWM93_3149 [Frankiales bacterium]|nr:hypothetical protein [Frankiales bacterium]